MTFKNKPVHVTIVGDAKEEYEKLNRIVGEEIAKGVRSSDHQTLFRSLRQKIELLKENPQYGTHIEKDKIPKEYIKDYEVNNLWKVNLPRAWRLIYSIRGSEIEILAVILDMLNHREYEKKFKYKKS